MTERTLNDIGAAWSANPMISANPNAKELIKEQQTEWFKGLKAELDGVAVGTPQEREAKQIDIVNKWSSKEQIAKYQPDLVATQNQDRAAIQKIRDAYPDAKDAIAIPGKTAADVTKAISEAQPGQTLILYVPRDPANPKGPWEWRKVTKAQTAQKGEAAQLPPAEKGLNRRPF
jgi:hypothetical protein